MALTGRQENLVSRVVALDSFDSKGLIYMRELFPGVIEPGDPLHASWTEHAVGLFVAKSGVTEDILRTAKNLKFIVRHGTGYDNIDVEACRRLGIRVCYCPGVSAMSVAELVLAHTSACAKNLIEVTCSMKAGMVLSKKSKCLFGATGLTGKTFGIMGGGTIGQLVARKFIGAYDGKVMLLDPHIPEDRPGPWSTIPHIRVLSMHDLLTEVDVLSLHVPLTPDTRDLIGARELAMMKPTAILINTARGGVVNEEALWAALRDGVIASAGVDAWVHEPPTREAYGEVFDLQNLTATPHIGGSPEEVQTATCIQMCDRMAELISGRTARDVIV